MATLDERGELENLPFMPEMLKFCGQRLTVHKVAHKLCDTITGSGIHKMENAVHLTGSRCDGMAHGGCQTACSLYWKEAWLKRVEPGAAEFGDRRPHRSAVTGNQHTQGARAGRRAALLVPGHRTVAGRADLPAGLATSASTSRMSRPAMSAPYASLKAFLVVFFNRLQGVSKRLLPRRLWFRDGLPWGFVKGRLSVRHRLSISTCSPARWSASSPRSRSMQPLTRSRLNRGMGFEEEMARYCGRTARVQARVTKCLDEKTGRMLTMKNPCIVLEDVVCDGVYNGSCPRQFIPFWREIWLERV